MGIGQRIFRQLTLTQWLKYLVVVSCRGFDSNNICICCKIDEKYQSCRNKIDPNFIWARGSQPQSHRCRRYTRLPIFLNCCNSMSLLFYSHPSFDSYLPFFASNLNSVGLLSPPCCILFSIWAIASVSYIDNPNVILTSIPLFLLFNQSSFFGSFSLFL